MTATDTKAVLGLCNLLVILGVVIFLPAWSLDFWQAWVYLVCFGAAAIAITIYLWKNDPKLLERRVVAGPIAEARVIQKIIQAFASLFFILLFVVAGLDHRMHWSYVPTAMSLLADIGVLIGFYIVFRVFKVNTFTSATIEVATDQKIISTGPYAVVRHPMYSGALLMLIATPIALGSYCGVLFVIPMIAVIVWRLFDEEKYLLENLGGYSDYCLHTRRRLIPFLW